MVKKQDFYNTGEKAKEDEIELKQKNLIFLLKRKISKWERKFNDFDVLIHF